MSEVAAAAAPAELTHPRMMAGVCNRVDARSLLRLVPQVDPLDLADLRREWARWVMGSRHGFANWQQAWNEWVDSSRGQVSFRQSRCRECRGGFSQKSLMRTGSPVCRSCQGTRKGSMVTVEVQLADDHA